MTITVAFSPAPGRVDEILLEVQPGATVADAIAASGLSARHAGFDVSSLPVGIWGASCERSRVLRERDRVELYRPLTVDPKEARRRRYRASRSKPAATGS